MVDQLKHGRKKERSRGNSDAVSNCSANKFLRVLRNMFNYVDEIDLIDKNPFKKIKFIKEKHKDPTILTPEKEGGFYKELQGNRRA